jgi:hypothetical protein
MLYSKTGKGRIGISTKRRYLTKMAISYEMGKIFSERLLENSFYYMYMLHVYEHLDDPTGSALRRAIAAVKQRW